ncbi:kinase non-catalytic C-lobe domain-containing protein 1-like isoform X2 [Branchiostoma floridae]|uniref:Kinase non-catalytic C-lobe domain-containing protein 1-like isoform X2 n=1 Tax=Branchiostoma floridae TaxID=7739 RepID=A0A9J7KWV1_BRAFL|nr:kinase non-catalytic C-lobe domain-containing protein 1-like isoform X2 [Branchiostoma floridae]
MAGMFDDYEYDILPTLLEDEENVSLADILALRDECLSEQELWAICRETCMALRSIEMSDLFQTLCITPETLAFNAAGNVCFMDILDDNPEGIYIPPEYDKTGNTFKAHLYSLGATLWAAAHYVIEPEVEPVISPGFRELVTRMTYENPTGRSSLEQVIDMCDGKLQGVSSQKVCRSISSKGRRILSIESLNDIDYAAQMQQHVTRHPHHATQARRPRPRSLYSPDSIDDTRPSQDTTTSPSSTGSSKTCTPHSSPDKSPTKTLTGSPLKSPGKVGLSLGGPSPKKMYSPSFKSNQGIVFFPDGLNVSAQNRNPTNPKERNNDNEQLRHHDSNRNPLPQAATVSVTTGTSVSVTTSVVTSPTATMNNEGSFHPVTKNSYMLLTNKFTTMNLNTSEQKPLLRRPEALSRAKTGQSEVQDTHGGPSGEGVSEIRPGTVSALLERYRMGRIENSGKDREMDTKSSSQSLNSILSPTSVGDTSGVWNANALMRQNSADALQESAKDSGDSAVLRSSAFAQVMDKKLRGRSRSLEEVIAADSTMKCLSLQSILTRVGSCLQEREVWALCRESMISLEKDNTAFPSYLSLDTIAVEESGKIAFQQGEGEMETLYLAPEMQKGSPPTEQACVFGVAASLWSAADWGLPANQEPALSDQLEGLLVSMTQDKPGDRPSIREVLQICNSYDQRSDVSSRLTCERLVREAMRAEVFNENNLVQQCLKEEAEERKEQFRASVVAAIDMADPKSALKPASFRPVAERPKEPTGWDQLLEQIQKPPHGLRQVTEPKVFGVKDLFEANPYLLKTLRIIRRPARSRNSPKSDAPKALPSAEQGRLDLVGNIRPSKDAGQLIADASSTESKMEPVSSSGLSDKEQKQSIEEGSKTISDSPKLMAGPESAFRSISNIRPKTGSLDQMSGGEMSSSPSTKESSPSLPSAFTSSATHFTPIVLTSLKEKSVTGLQNPQTGSPPKKISTKKIVKAVRKDLLLSLKNRPPPTLANDLEKDLEEEMRKTSDSEKADSPATAEQRPEENKSTAKAEKQAANPEVAITKMPPVAEVKGQVQGPRQSHTDGGADSLGAAAPASLATSNTNAVPSHSGMSGPGFHSGVPQQMVQPTQNSAHQVQPPTAAAAGSQSQMPSLSANQPFLIPNIPISGMYPNISVPMQLQQDPQTGFFQLVPVNMPAIQITPPHTHAGVMGTMPAGGEGVSTSNVQFTQALPDSLVSSTSTSSYEAERGANKEPSETVPKKTWREISEERKSPNPMAENRRAAKHGGSESNKDSKAPKPPPRTKHKSGLTLGQNEVVLSKSDQDLSKPARKPDLNTSKSIESIIPMENEHSKSPARKKSDPKKSNKSRSRKHLDKSSELLTSQGVSPSPPLSYVSRDSGVQLSKSSTEDMTQLDTTPTPEEINGTLGKVTQLIREEFAFDGYLENGVEDRAMADYIMSLANLRWGTFSDAVTEKYCDLYWEEELLEKLFEAINGRMPEKRHKAKLSSPKPPPETARVLSIDEPGSEGDDNYLANQDIDLLHMFMGRHHPIREEEEDHVTGPLFPVESRSTRKLRGDSLLSTTSSTSSSSSAKHDKTRQPVVPKNLVQVQSAEEHSDTEMDMDTGMLPGNLGGSQAVKPKLVRVRSQDTASEGDSQEVTGSGGEDSGGKEGSKFQRLQQSWLRRHGREYDSDSSSTSGKHSPKTRLKSQGNDRTKIRQLLDSTMTRRNSSSSLNSSAPSMPNSQYSNEYASSFVPNSALVSSSSRSRSHGSPASSVVYLGAENLELDPVLQDYTRQLGAMDEEKKQSIEAKIAEVEQQLMFEQKQRSKSQKFLRRLLESDRKGKDAEWGLSHGENKAMASKLNKQIMEMSERLEFLESAKKHLEMLYAEQWGLDHSLLYSFATSTSAEPMQLEPADVNPLLMFQWCKEGDGAGGYARGTTLQAGTPVGLFSYLFARDSLMEGFIHHFFYTYRYFACPSELLSFITEKFHSAISVSVDQLDNKVRVHCRTIDLMQVWVEGFFELDFKHDAELTDRLMAFIRNKIIPLDTQGESLLRLTQACQQGRYMALSGTMKEAPEENEGELFQMVNDRIIMEQHQALKKTNSFRISLSLPKKMQGRQAKLARANVISCLNNRRDLGDDQSVYQLALAREKDGFTLSEYTSRTLAEQLTLMEQELFSKAHPIHYLNSRAHGVGVSGNLTSPNTPRTQRLAAGSQEPDSPSLFHPDNVQDNYVLTLLEHAQNLSHWVGAEIVCCNSAKSQLAVLTKFIHVAKACYDMRNFATSIAILDALDNLIVRQLPAWRSLPSKVLQIMEDLNAVKVILKSDSGCLVDGENHRGRATIPPTLLFLMHVQQQEIGAFTMANGMYKWAKLRSIARLIDQIRLFKEHRFQFEADNELQQLLWQRIQEFRGHDLQMLASEHVTNYHQLSGEKNSRKFHDALRRVKATFQ